MRRLALFLRECVFVPSGQKIKKIKRPFVVLNCTLENGQLYFRGSLTFGQVF